MSGGRLVHQCLVHDGEDQVAAVAGAVLREGLAAGEVAVVAGGARLVGLVAEAVGDGRLRTAVQDRPARSVATEIARLQRFVRREVARGAHGVRMVGEPDFGAGDAAWRQRLRYEAVTNHALAGSPFRGLCPLDARRVPPQALASWVSTHPHLCGPDAGPVPNPGYRPPPQVLAALAPAPVADPLERAEPVADLQGVQAPADARDAVRWVAMGTRLPLPVVDGFVVAVSEVVSNALRHGRAPVRVRVWAQAARLLCTVTDRGSGHDAALAGYGPAPERGLPDHAGLWAARQLVDDLRARTDDDGFTVALDVSAPASTGLR